MATQIITKCDFCQNHNGVMDEKNYRQFRKITISRFSAMPNVNAPHGLLGTEKEILLCGGCYDAYVKRNADFM